MSGNVPQHRALMLAGRAGFSKRSDTEVVTETVSAWRDRVQAAAMAADGEALTRLFVEGQRLLGSSLGREWAAALSGLDGTAVTG